MLTIRIVAVELVHELAEYLSRRYPCDFEVVRHSERVCDDDDGSRSFCDWGWEGLPAIRTVRMTSLDVSYQIPISVDDGERAAERAMEIAGLMYVIWLVTSSLVECFMI